MEQEQRRGRRIALTVEERDRFLAEQRTCRLGTVGADGAPHVSALWFHWDGGELWLSSLVRSQRWTNVRRDPRVSALVDAGGGYDELVGVQVTGSVEIVDSAHASLDRVEAAYARKYGDTAAAGVHDRRHGWLRVVPARLVSWDFRKLPA